jgi:hydrogenase/urease accessory protein HupE
MKRFFWFLLSTILCGLLFSNSALAHTVGLSRGTYRLDGAMFMAELVFARADAALLARDLDADSDGTISASEVQNAKSAFGKTIIPKLSVRAGNDECLGSLDDAHLVEEDGLFVRMTYLCPTPPASAHIRFDVLDALTRGHRHIAMIEATSGATEEVIFAAHREWDVLPGAAGEKPKAVESRDLGGYFFLGIEHILFGYDHLVFLLGLVLVGGRWRALLLVITAFTLAHSITLGLAVLGIWAPSPRIVEPLIALSVAYVGIENQFVKDAEKRWRITFPFGLIHGFGFAGALGEIQLPKADVPKALLGFNLGVEVGQLAVMAIVLPLIMAARKRPWFEQKGVRYASYLIAGLGIVWFVTRIVEN